MALHDAIYFQHRISKLNELEFQGFCVNAFSSFNKRHLLTTSLFHLLSYQATQNQNDSATILNKIIDDIIDERDQSKLQVKIVNELPTVTFRRFPSVLISLFSSYLKLSDIINFQLCNRQIYIALSSLSTSITSISNPTWITSYKNNYGTYKLSQKHQIDNLNRFAMVKNITFDAQAMYDIQNNKHFQNCLHSVWNNLTELTIENLSIPSSNTNYLMEIHPIWQSITNALTKLRFDKLKLNNLNMKFCDSYDLLIDFLCNNSEIKSICIQNKSCPASRSVKNCNNFIKLYALNNLTALAIFDTNQYFIDGIISILGPQLECLHVASYDNDCLPKVSYNKLKELCVCDMDFYSIKYVVTNANSIERFNFAVLSDVDFKDQSEMLMDVISNPKLEYLTINATISDSNLSRMCEYFINGFKNVMKNKKMVQNKIKIRLTLFSSNFIADLMELLKLMKQNIKEFVMIIEPSWSQNECERMVSEIKSDSSYIVMVTTTGGISISNKTQTMSMYHENSIMECIHCQ
eukprot:246202_1